MGTLNTTKFIEFTDKLTASYLGMKGTSGSGYGMGDSSLALGSDWGCSRKNRELETIVLAWQDYDLGIALLQPTHRINDQAPHVPLARALYFDLLNTLNLVCRNTGLTGVTDIDSFADYYNFGAGGPYAALLAPDFRDLFHAVYGAYPDARNVYAPAIANMGQHAVAGAFVDGSAVDTTKYAGFTILQAQVSGWAGSSGTLTVAVSGRDVAGNNATGHWTATISGNGNVNLTVGSSTVKIATDVTGITLPGTMTAGTVVIAGLIPSGRTNPPT